MIWLRILAWLLPARARWEWLREWHAELWAVRSEYRRSWLRREIAALRFLFGAWSDVFAVREIAGVRWTLAWSDVLSVRWMSTAVVVLFVVAVSVPASRWVLYASPYHADGLVLMKDAALEKVSGAEFAEWQSKKHLPIQWAAFYSVSEQRANGEVMRVAVATPEMMRVLNADRVAAAFLSAEGARRLGNPSVISVGGMRYAVAVLPETTLRLPEEPEVFLFSKDVSVDQHGYVVAEKRQWNEDLHWGSQLHHSDDTLMTVLYVPLVTRTVVPWRAFCFALVLVVFSLPASRPLSQRDRVLEPGDLPAMVRLRSMGFVLLQMSVVVVACGLVALVVASMSHRSVPAEESLLQMVVMFALALPILRAVLNMHQHRCPRCLRPLGCPARVGRPSTSFLGWYGVEVVCAQGHGLVHIPDLPTTWFPAPRWVPMDASWAELFEITP